MATTRRALVIGGSMSGLLTAVMLLRRGWQVDVFERAEDELAGRGAGIVAQSELIARLVALGINTSDLGVAISTRTILDRSGSVSATSICPQILTAWERVYRVLRDAFPQERYHRARGLKAFAQDADGVTAHFSDGSTERGDVLVGADGLRSTVRQLCLPEIVPLYAGYVAWRALLSESDFPPAIHRELFMLMTFCLPPGEQCLGYPVAGPNNDLREGRRRYNVVWYRPAGEASELPRLLTDRNGVTHSISIPPPLIRAEPIAAMRAASERLLAPQMQLAFGRVAIVGDAAFVARPHVAAGVSKASDDAAALAEALGSGDGIENALRRFEAARLPDNRKIIERARHLGAYLQATQTAEERARSARHSIPEAVLAETAMIDFLQHH
jgi:2-polyprenyl-6-methoxyphenol hydroxylase-like FAD-dependent oxidoreductase